MFLRNCEHLDNIGVTSWDQSRAIFTPATEEGAAKPAAPCGKTMKKHLKNYFERSAIPSHIRFLMFFLNRFL